MRRSSGAESLDAVDGLLGAAWLSAIIAEVCVSMLFSPITFGPVTLSNRVLVAPMCQYSAVDGRATSWHTIHLGTLSQSGAGLLIVEATAVLPEGRITFADLGLYDDACEQALAQVLQAVRQWSPMPMGIQLAHAGRKASTQTPWKGGQCLPPEHPHGWPIVAPSAIAWDPDSSVPHALTETEIDQIVTAFQRSAQRAEQLGFAVIEIHAAHGYLLHQFLSPLSNQRTDRYGGSLKNRMRLLLTVFDAVKQSVSSDCAVGVRLSATDWVDGGWDVEQSITLAQALEMRGCDYLHVSSGGLDPRQQIPVKMGYQVPLASAIRAHLRMPIIAVGRITDPHQAQEILVDGHADAVAIARAMLYDPRWPWHAAAALGASVQPAPQYLRCEPPEHQGVFGT